jgi:uncharacterized membrane protein
VPGRSIIQLGLLLLIVTSVARVAYVVYAFRVKRIGSYSAVAPIVLLLLAYVLA